VLAGQLPFLAAKAKDHEPVRRVVHQPDREAHGTTRKPRLDRAPLVDAAAEKVREAAMIAFAKSWRRESMRRNLWHADVLS
jgi:hypothetical protein